MSKANRHPDARDHHSPVHSPRRAPAEPRVVYAVLVGGGVGAGGSVMALLDLTSEGVSNKRPCPGLCSSCGPPRRRPAWLRALRACGRCVGPALFAVGIVRFGLCRAGAAGDVRVARGSLTRSCRRPAARARDRPADAVFLRLSSLDGDKSIAFLPRGPLPVRRRSPAPQRWLKLVSRARYALPRWLVAGARRSRSGRRRSSGRSALTLMHLFATCLASWPDRYARRTP